MEEQTLGQRIGVVSHTLSVTNTKDENVTITIKVDYSTASNVEIISWLNSNRGIAFQRPTRLLSKDEISNLSGNMFNAVTIGSKAKSVAEITTNMLNVYAGKSKVEVIEMLMKSGLNEIKAELMADAIMAE